MSRVLLLCDKTTELKVKKMPRVRNPDSYKAEEMYKKGMKLVEIANKLNLPKGTVRRWKCTYKWDSKRSDGKESVRKKKENNKKAVEEEVEQVIDNPDLTDKQRLFCLHYIRCFNATKAYRKAYGCSYETALTNGPALLGNARIKNEIKRLKQNRLNREMLDEHDIFQKYMDIAMADITDFVDFGQEEVRVFNMFGPVMEEDKKTGEKKPVTKIQNVVKLKESSEVDGSLISEIRQGKGGVSVKLADRMKAMDWITKHMDMATAEQRARIKHLIAQTEKVREETETIRQKREDAW